MDHYLVATLGRFVEWVPVCPEVEICLSIPRETLRLVGDPEAPRLIAPESGHDYTEQMQAWARGRAEELAAERLHSFVFKKDPPSSGLFRIRMHGENGMPRRVGMGMFPSWQALAHLVESLSWSRVRRCLSSTRVGFLRPLLYNAFT